MKEEIFSSIDLVHQCLIDDTRTNAFKKAINEVINSNDDSEVLDVGTGTGIMALLAAKAGAKQVMAVEYDKDIASVARNNVRTNGLDKKISVVVGDAKKYKYGNIDPFDVVIMEMLTTGMIDEHQVKAINNLYKRKVVKNSTKFIPYKFDTFATLINADFYSCGFKMKMVKHLWHGLSQNQKYIKMSEQTLLNSVNFSSIIKEDQNIEKTFKMIKKGIVNSVLLTSRAYLSRNVYLDDTETLNAPVVIPIADISVEKGNKIKLDIKYTFGKGYKNFDLRTQIVK